MDLSVVRSELPQYLSHDVHTVDQSVVRSEWPQYLSHDMHTVDQCGQK